MWNYLYFVLHAEKIYEKERTILEKYVHDKVCYVCVGLFVQFVWMDGIWFLFLDNSTACLTFEIMPWQVFESTPSSTDFFPRKKARVLPNDGIKTGDEEKEEKADKN